MFTTINGRRGQTDNEVSLVTPTRSPSLDRLCAITANAAAAIAGASVVVHLADAATTYFGLTHHFAHYHAWESHAASSTMIAAHGVLLGLVLVKLPWAALAVSWAGVARIGLVGRFARYRRVALLAVPIPAIFLAAMAVAVLVEGVANNLIVIGNGLVAG